MVDAINSVLANAPLLRNDAEQASSRVSVAELQVARDQAERQQVSLTRNDFATQNVSETPQAPFISPVVSINTQFDTAVLLLRNSEDGEVVDQIPSESALQTQQRQISATEQSQSEQEQQTRAQSSELIRFQTQNIADVSPTESISSPAEISASQVSANSLESVQSLQNARNLGQTGNNVNTLV